MRSRASVLSIAGQQVVVQDRAGADQQVDGCSGQRSKELDGEDRQQPVVGVVAQVGGHAVHARHHVAMGHHEHAGPAVLPEV